MTLLLPFTDDLCILTVHHKYRWSLEGYWIEAISFVSEYQTLAITRLEGYLFISGKGVKHEGI